MIHNTNENQEQPKYGSRSNRPEFRERRSRRERRFDDEQGLVTPMRIKFRFQSYINSRLGGDRRKI